MRAHSAGPERPLRGWAKSALELAAGFAIAIFYLYATVAVVVLLVLITLELAAALALARFGLTRLLLGPLQLHLRLLTICLRSVWLRPRPALQVPLERADAPRLFAILEELARRLHVPPPKAVRIEMNASAWVMLRGVRRGANATTLGLGYDLVAGLTERELEAVLAHEMAHAKFVRRGLKRALNGGVARAASLANALAGVVAAQQRTRGSAAEPKWLHAGARWCVRVAAQFVSAYSRQDEFEADRGAAELCGAAPLRSSLLKLEALTAKAARISWSERVAQLQTGRFGEWLTGELTTVPDAGATAATEAFNPYSTHPSLPDRLAALPEDAAAAPPSAPAIELFAERDALAARLVGAIHRFAADEERRDSRERRRWLRRLRRGTAIRPVQWLGALGFVIGLIIAGFAWAGTFTVVPLLIGATIAAAGVLVYRHGRYHDRLILPVPQYEQLLGWSDRRDDPATRPQREQAIGTELDHAVPAALRAKARAAQYVALALDALGTGDYLRATVAERRALASQRGNVAAQMIGAVAWANLREGPQALNLLQGLSRSTGLRSAALRWGAAWTLVSLGQWASAEPLLDELLAAEPGQPTFAALLALCRANRGKLQTGIAAAQVALAAAPRSKPRLELLVGMQVSAGYTADAEQRLNDAGALVEGDVALMLARIRLLMLRRDFAGADMWIDRLQQRGIEGHVNVTIGGLCETARRDEAAAAHYRAALARAFYPAAELGLARLAVHRHDRAAARAHALAALDTTKPTGASAASAVDLVPGVLGIMLQLEEPIVDAKAWLVSRSTLAGPFTARSFLVLAADAQRAEAFVRALFDALEPQRAGPPPLLQVNLAAAGRQPVGPVHPGIHSFQT